MRHHVLPSSSAVILSRDSGRLTPLKVLPFAPLYSPGSPHHFPSLLPFDRAPNPEQSLAGTARYRGRNSELPGEPASSCLPSLAIPFPRARAHLLMPLLDLFVPRKPCPRAHPSSPALVPSLFARRGHQRKRGRTTRWSPCSPNRAASPRVPAASEDPLEALLPFSGSSPATVCHSPATPSGEVNPSPSGPLDRDLVATIRTLAEPVRASWKLPHQHPLSAPIANCHLAP